MGVIAYICFNSFINSLKCMRMTNFTSLKSTLLAALFCIAGSATAQTVLLSEDFSKCTSTSPDNPASEITKEDKTSMENYPLDGYTQIDGWIGTKVYEGEGNIKLGTSSKAGSVTLPALDLSDVTATYTLIFKACAWSGDATTLSVQVDEQEPVAVEGLSNSGAPYAANLKEFSVVVTGTSASKITISSKERFFLDDIQVTKLAAGETPAPSVNVPSIVAFGSIGVGTQQTEEVSLKGANLTADLAVSLSGEGFSCETTSISMSEAEDAILKIVFAPDTEGDYSGTLTISGGGLQENIVVAISGKAIQLEGQGTKEAPYTVADVVALNNPGNTAWVEGFIVGYAKQSLDNAVLGSIGEDVQASNILIAASASETDVTKCVPVQLPSGAVRTALNLKDNPENLGKPVTLLGSLEAYFGTCGIKETSEYVLDGKEPVDISNAPETAYTVAKAQELIQAGEGLGTPVYVKGVITEIEEVSPSFGNATYYINDTETAEGQLCVYRGHYLEGEKFTAEDQIKKGDEVIVYGTLVLYGGDTPQITNSEIYSLNGATGITGITADKNAPVEVYTLGGVKVGDSLDGLQKGIYIVKQGNKVTKVIK